MRNKNLTQERRYAVKFDKRIKNEEYLVKLNTLIAAINNTDAKALDAAFTELRTCSTKGLSASIRKIFLNNEKRVYLLANIDAYDKANEKIIKNAYKQLSEDFTKLRVELMKKMIG